MYGADRIQRWKAARDLVFDGDASLRKVFDSVHLEPGGLA
jgi:hypothetical protein